MQAQLRKANRQGEVMSMDGESRLGRGESPLEIGRVRGTWAFDACSSTSRSPIDRASEETSEEERLVAELHHSLALWSSRVHTFSPKISVADPGSGGID